MDMCYIGKNSTGTIHRCIRGGRGAECNNRLGVRPIYLVGRSEQTPETLNSWEATGAGKLCRRCFPGGVVR